MCSPSGEHIGLGISMRYAGAKASQLNHADVKTTQIYARLADDPAKRAMEDHGERIVEVAKGLRVVKG